jgi:leader peptidase (prepilin peptidase)/N-methyltransferase
MMLAALIGLMVGCFLNWAGDYLPCLSADHRADCVESTRPPACATWHLLTSPLSRSVSNRPHEWYWLRLGVELLSALFFAYVWGQAGPSWKALLFAAIYSFFLLIAIIDLKHRLVPNLLTYPAMAATLLYNLLLARQEALNMLLGGAMAFGVFFLTARLRPGDLGGGDVKLAALIGLAFGFPQVWWALMMGAGLGGIVAAFMLLTGRLGAKSRVPYAPFLCFGAMVALLYNPLPRFLAVSYALEGL